MVKKINFGFLNQKSKDLRVTILKTIFNAKTGHIGGSLSIVEILISIYYSKIFNLGPKLIKDKKRDRVIVSKGHCTAAFYSMLSDLGYLKKDEIKTYCKNNSRLGGHLSIKVPGVEIESGSLGHGLSVAAGIAWSAKMNNEKFKVIVILSDAELYEGSVWEALLFISHYNLNNLLIIIDRNYQVVMNRTEEFLKLEPLDKKLKSFNYDVKKVNGNNIKEIIPILNKFKTKISSKPKFIIAETKKGKGINFMENKIKWHHSVPNEKEFNDALKYLKK